MEKTKLAMLLSKIDNSPEMTDDDALYSINDALAQNIQAISNMGANTGCSGNTQCTGNSGCTGNNNCQNNTTCDRQKNSTNNNVCKKEL